MLVQVLETCLQVDPSPMSLTKHGLELEKGLEATFKRCWKKDGLKYP
jgi:hypothetical protein